MIDCPASKLSAANGGMALLDQTMKLMACGQLQAQVFGHIAR